MGGTTTSGTRRFLPPSHRGRGINGLGLENPMKDTITGDNDILGITRQITVSDTCDADVDVVLFDGDCGDLLKDIPSSSVDLVITSPPYNIGKKYGAKNDLTVISKESGACH